jgi:hypothetical protein
MLRSLLILAALACPAWAHAQQATTSPGPEKVSVTIYRAPHRSAAEAMDLRWLNGYALISETRQVTIPAGEGTIRFEGVAGGIIPESAIVTGLPEGVVEKNQDAYLLSPGSLIERSLGRRVHLRRTSRATGEVREQEAVIRSGPDGAVVLQTPEGFEALRCTGVNETIVYPQLPEGLSAKPTLSVRTRSPRAASATVTLSYLASGFDWQANYVATLSPAGDRLELFAWVTLANGDETSFVNAGTQAVAGKVNREDFSRPLRPTGQELNLRCWPSATTSDIEEPEEGNYGGFPPPPPPPPPPAPAAMMDESIVVTGSRVRRQALQEELGDLKLYRIPDPVTVASNSQKQVAMLDQPSVKVDVVYRQVFIAQDPPQTGGVTRVLVTKNRKAEGLGLPLPAGRLVLFGAGRQRPILLGEGYVDDKAVGEDVEIEIGSATGIVTRAVVSPGRSEDERIVDLVVTNDRAEAVRFEAEIEEAGGKLSSSTRLGRRDGRPLWAVTVPANGSAKLRYRIRRN